MLDIELKILDPRLGSTWPLPSYATEASAGLDMRACLDVDITLAPGETRMISAGISIYLADADYAAILLPRSGLGAKGLVLGNLVGLIDADYQGPLIMACWNRSTEMIAIAPGDRIAQLIIVPIARAQFKVVEQFAASERGSGGYGHTGLR
jgi:dUTP pyrophosphatase